MSHSFIFRKYGTPRFWLIVMHHGGSTDLCNKCPLLCGMLIMKDWGWGGVGRKLQEISVPSSQFFYAPKSAKPKGAKKKNKTQKQKNQIHTHAFCT